MRQKTREAAAVMAEKSRSAFGEFRLHLFAVGNTIVVIITFVNGFCIKLAQTAEL